MRWEDLFTDLEAQQEAAEARLVEADVAELSDAESASVTLSDRIRARLGRELTLYLGDGERVHGVVRDACRAWVVLEGQRAIRMLVPIAAIGAAEPLAEAAPIPAGARERLSLGHALRSIAATGETVRVTIPGHVVAGVIARVGSDHFDLAPHGNLAADPGWQGGWTIPFARVSVVTS